MTGDSSNPAARLYVRVTPRAGRNEITGFTEGVLHVKLAALPDKGKANKELIDYLSKVLGTGKSSLRLLKGHTSRNKVIEVDGLSLDDITRLISSGPSSSGATR